MDERIDLTRAVRDERYAYIRNFLPHRQQGQYLDYMFQTPTTRAWKAAYDAGKLNAAQSAFWQPKPAEELYDLQNDPHQIHNLAADPQQSATLNRFRQALQDWMLDIKDVGLVPEGELDRLAGQDARYSFGHDPQRYPIERVFQVADAASRHDLQTVDQMADHLNDEHPAVRFWAMVGLLTRGLAGEKLPLTLVEQRMKHDSSSVVRSTAAEALARLGVSAQRQAAFDCLLTEADQAKSNPYEAMQALNSLAHSDPRPAEFHGRLKALPRKNDEYPERVNGYVDRLLAYLEAL